MIVNIITETEILLSKQLSSRNLSDDDERDLRQYDDRDIISCLIEFADNLKVTEASNLGDVKPEQVKILTIKVK